MLKTSPLNIFKACSVFPSQELIKSVFDSNSTYITTSPSIDFMSKKAAMLQLTSCSSPP